MRASLIKTITVLTLMQFRILILGVYKLQKNLEDLTRQVRNLKEHKRDRNVKTKCWNCDKGSAIKKTAQNVDVTKIKSLPGKYFEFQ